MNNRGFALYSALALVYAFLYLPIALLVIYSFNASKLVTVWGGFSTKWYGELLHDSQVLDAAWLSLKIAFVNACSATILGTLAAVVLVRFKRYPGRALFTGMVSAPLVMPEIITGLALLLLFVGMEHLLGWPDGRSMTTIVIAHITFSLSFVTVVVRSRLSQMDMSLEEAAMDLGARPLTVFLRITLPIIAPALAAGWLLAFTLSVDDVVISAFVSGPGATPLPIVIFSKVRLGVSPEINALATIVVALVGIAIAIAGRVMMTKEQQGG
ncbi:Putrescine transport system permease protein PotI [Paramagnetospirillum magnetotacticum MS-1]|uniref:Putrescine transport system permease protein PotI n=1 Tax=Paramagnetospirillum magnetotacticum MS-1 TaxID=272627 RepID=A0A0C2YH64_PARME|nr:ABC transporter permease subunit [Paramagnetospirillum magnetotacticum]KIL99059.1 Putrescine transport system permease protein PotI [Paramagnetospirillum magnetotacticum MS-1]